MSYPVVSKVSYFLAHTPCLLTECGSTQMLERVKNPQGSYLGSLMNSLRTYEEVVGYAPNQAFIGNIKPEDLKALPQPWYKHLLPNAQRFGRFGEIMPEDEFLGVMKMVDTFDLVILENGFTDRVRRALENHPLFSTQELERLGAGVSQHHIEELVGRGTAIPLSIDERLIGCVKQAHDWDHNLAAHVMVENLATKASAVMAGKYLLSEKPEIEIEYIIECSEEACGDMNQRGGGNFAKAIGEMCGCQAATGSDTRGFCAAPNHAIIQAAALVQAGVFKSVMVVAGGSVAKLGMNGRDHVAKGVPILEDVIGGFALLICPDDGRNPLLRTDLIGCHRIGSGASPQLVMQSIVTEPLERGQLKIMDIDRYAAEMQNPEITEPAGAGDVPRANYRMIAALAVLKGEIERNDIQQFVEERGVPGYAPTQGHIPSGIPYLGHAREDIIAGKIEKAMFIAKGSLFLGRMTNLFDGVSFILQRNDGRTGSGESSTSRAELKAMVASAFRQVAELLSESDRPGR
ncbi:MAG: glycine reductase [Firmicutes bacterium]|nr:glycine reductase [Bacillota bacterium]